MSGGGVGPEPSFSSHSFNSRDSDSLGPTVRSGPLRRESSAKQQLGWSSFRARRFNGRRSPLKQDRSHGANSKLAFERRGPLGFFPRTYLVLGFLFVHSNVSVFAFGIGGLVAPERTPYKLLHRHSLAALIIRATRTSRTFPPSTRQPTSTTIVLRSDPQANGRSDDGRSSSLIGGRNGFLISSRLLAESEAKSEVYTK